MENSYIYGKNAIIEALEAGNREFNRILISNNSRSDEKLEKIKDFNYEINSEEGSEFTYYTIYNPEGDMLDSYDIVIKDGEIAERGKHSDLLDDGGIYQELYETQFGKALSQEN